MHHEKIRSEEGYNKFEKRIKKSWTYYLLYQRGETSNRFVHKNEASKKSRTLPCDYQLSTINQNKANKPDLKVSVVRKRETSRYDKTKPKSDILTGTRNVKKRRKSGNFQVGGGENRLWIATGGYLRGVASLVHLNVPDEGFEKLKGARPMGLGVGDPWVGVMGLWGRQEYFIT